MAHLTNFSIEVFMRFSNKMPLYFSMVQKSHYWQKPNQIRGGGGGGVGVGWGWGSPASITILSYLAKKTTNVATSEQLHNCPNLPNILFFINKIFQKIHTYMNSKSSKARITPGLHTHRVSLRNFKFHDLCRSSGTVEVVKLEGVQRNSACNPGVVQLFLHWGLSTVRGLE